MRIAFLTPEYVTESNFDGGLANYLQRVALSLQSLGHEAEVFTRSDRDEKISYNGITVHRVNPRNLLFGGLNRLTGRRFPRVTQALGLALNLRTRVLHRHRSAPFDIVQAASYLACGLGLTLGRVVPVVTRLSSYEPLWRKVNQEPLTGEQAILERLEMSALRRSQGVYGPSRFLAEYIQRDTGVPVQVIEPPFVPDTTPSDPSVFEKELGSRKYLLFFGTLGFMKGVATLADALPEILSTHPDLSMVLVGKDGGGPGGRPMMEYIRQRAGPHIDRVVHLGVLKQAQLRPVVAGAAAVTLPSLVDNLPNTCLESMAQGKVVIGTRGTSFESLIDEGRSGILVRPGDAKDLAAGVNRVLALGEIQRAEMGRLARQRIGQLAPDLACQRLLAYYREVRGG